MRLFVFCFSLCFLLATLASALLVGAVIAPGPLENETVIIVPQGTSVNAIGAQLKSDKAILSPLLLRLAAHAIGPLKAGEYALPPQASPLQIAKILHAGHSIPRTFTATEGLTSADIVRLLLDDPALSGTITEIPAEGSLLPETYRYVYADSREGMVARMQKAMQDKVLTLWQKRSPNLRLGSPEEAIVLASIVEKETGVASERARIAGVFYNRLHKRMRLQSDPTVIYALTRGRQPLGRPLLHADLAYPDPINTYTSSGLPPQPICNPGTAALEAVFYPEDHSFLYFVADGTGGHVFASSLAAHNRNVNAWRKSKASARLP